MGLWQKIESAMYGIVFFRPMKKADIFFARMWKYLAWIFGLGSFLLLIAVDIATGRASMSRIFLALLLGLTFFCGFLLMGWFWNRFILPVTLEMDGTDPEDLEPEVKVQPVTQAGRAIWRLWLVYVITNAAIWNVSMGGHFLGTWGIALGAVFSVASTVLLLWRWRRIRHQRERGKSKS